MSERSHRSAFLCIACGQLSHNFIINLVILMGRKCIFVCEFAFRSWLSLEHEEVPICTINIFSGKFLFRYKFHYSEENDPAMSLSSVSTGIKA